MDTEWSRAISGVESPTCPWCGQSNPDAEWLHDGNRMQAADLVEAMLTAFRRGGPEVTPRARMTAALGTAIRNMPYLAAFRSAPTPTETPSAADGGDGGAEAMRANVEAALTEWTRPSAIRLMIGETTTRQEGRTANAVAAAIASKVRSAMTDAALPLPKDQALRQGDGR